ncbi:hypothetical protein BXZ70DRAFT_969358 [Cristinia sonorae]|uniref:SET domain-containing protein n=1 Tax=Cristinia sonorae TaxID=1940300 RepID=A0A8K0UTA5_9AGAR|nr:hypothetical protein BXZ70DRAFT_969358 [Cristinia sonorae]
MSGSISDPAMQRLAEMIANLGRVASHGASSSGTAPTATASGGPFYDASEAKRLRAQLDEAIAKQARELSLPPTKAQELPRAVLLAQFQQSRENSILLKQKELIYGPPQTRRTTYIGMAPEFSTKKLEDLKRISISDLMVRKRHKGSFLLCRVISITSHVVSINFAVEDPEGGATMLAVYHYPFTLDCSNEEGDVLFPINAVLAIREPWYQYTADGAVPMLRVDAVSDIVFMDTQHPLVKSISWSTSPATSHSPSTPGEWKDRGVSHFKRKQWLCAAIAFSEGLQLDPTHYLLLLNRAEVYLRLGWFNSAAHDAETVISMQLHDATLRRKAVVRAAKAYYALERYDTAMKLARTDPNDPDLKSIYSRSVQRVREATTGEYDWFGLHQATWLSIVRPEIASYTGPVQVKTSKKGLRGVFLTRAVKAGELLVLSKPIASCFTEDNPNMARETFIAHNLLTNVIGSRNDYAIIDITIQRMWDDPNLARTLQSMHAGDSLPTTEYNPTPSPAPPLSHPRVPCVDIDISRIEALCSLNSFDTVGGGDLERGPVTNTILQPAPALYDLPSFCNHSCIPSANRYFFGDILVLRASRNLKEGEEVTLNYCLSTLPYQERADLFKNKWKFVCKCNLCEADRADTQAERDARARIREMPDANSVSEARRRVIEVRSTYRDTPERRGCGRFRPHLCEAYQKLGTMYMKEINKEKGEVPEGLVRKSIEAFMDAMEAAGMVITDRSVRGKLRDYTSLPVDTTRPPPVLLETCVIAITQLVSAFMGIYEDDRAFKWMKTAVWLENLRNGGGSALFKDKYKERCAEWPV